MVGFMLVVLSGLVILIQRSPTPMPREMLKREQEIIGVYAGGICGYLQTEGTLTNSLAVNGRIIGRRLI